MRVVVLAPIDTSLYSKTVTHMVAQEPGLELAGVVLRTPWTLERFSQEVRRDGIVLVRKAYKMLILREKAYVDAVAENVTSLAKEIDLPDLPLSGLAKKYNVPFIKVKNHNDPAAVDFVQTNNADVVAFTGGGLIRQGMLDSAPLGVLNCHMGLLPPFRGMDVVEWPFLEHEGLPPTGIALHVMEAGLDTGPVLINKEIPWSAKDNDFVDFRRRFEYHMPVTMLEALRGLRDETLTPEPQKIADGRQYFVMHNRILAAALERAQTLTKKLADQHQR